MAQVTIEHNGVKHSLRQEIEGYYPTLEFQTLGGTHYIKQPAQYTLKLDDMTGLESLPWTVIQKYATDTTSAWVEQIGYQLTVKYKTGNTWGNTVNCETDHYLDYGTCGASTSGWGGWDNYKTYIRYQQGGEWVGCDVDWSTGQVHQTKTAEERMRDIIASRHAPAFLRHRGNRHNDIFVPNRFHPQRTKLPEKELRARETLRLVVGEDMYRCFLKNGFVTVQNPKSKNVYQIFPGHGLTCVYNKGIMIQRLCVYLKGDFPPTDAMIVRYLMAINNEDQLWALANKYGPIKNKAEAAQLDIPVERNLVEIMRELKKSKAA